MFSTTRAANAASRDSTLPERRATAMLIAALTTTNAATPRKSSRSVVRRPGTSSP
jgi:hypothetical protein